MPPRSPSGFEGVRCMMSMPQIVAVSMSLVFLVLGGCMADKQPSPPSFAMTPSSFKLMEPEPPPPAEGSLFNPGRTSSLFSDFRARHVGDVITIVIEENLKGNKDVKTKTERKSEMNLGLSGILGLEWNRRLEPRYKNSPANAEVDASKAIGGTTTSKFDGSGSTSRDTSLKGTVTARVIEVLPSGNLVIRGTRAIKINNETQYLVLTGIVRPRDLDAENRISSTRIADARIEYTGGGVLSEKQRPAWFGRLLGLMALF